MVNLKIIHIADTHLGANPYPDNPWQINREKEIWETFEKVVRRAEEEKADLLLIAGDMFHRQPLLRELKELNYIFSSLTHTRVVFIAGNHDYMKSNSYYRNFEWDKHIYCLIGKECESIYFADINTQVYGLSYDHYEIRENRYENIQIEDKSRINILLAHGGDEKHIPFSKAQLGMKGFDYVALGHIHTPGILIPERMAYSGSLEPIDMGDDGIHGFIRATIDKKGNKLEFIKCAKREYKFLDIQSNPSYTNKRIQEEIYKQINDEMNTHILWKVRIYGYRDNDIEYDVDEIYKLGKVVSVTDLTEPDYDFDRLSYEYSRNIIGKYIQTMKKDNMSDIEKKALYFGVKAMLDEMG